MDRSPEEIANYIKTNTAEYWNDSPLSSEQAANNWIFKAE
jgi:hypothetical protein